MTKLKAFRDTDDKVNDLQWNTDSIQVLTERIESAEDANAKARDNERYAETTAELTAAESKHRKLDGELRRLKEKREDMLAAAEFPLPGLTATRCGSSA